MRYQEPQGLNGRPNYNSICNSIWLWKFMGVMPLHLEKERDDGCYGADEHYFWYIKEIINRWRSGSING